MEVCVQIAHSVQCSMPSRSCYTAGIRGWQPRHAAHLSGWSPRSATKNDGSAGKNGLAVGARFLLVRSESSASHRARKGCLILVRAEKDGNGAEETPEVADFGLPGTVKKSAVLAPEFWLQVAIFVFAAGFVDAGFSGDWSRIGVLSKQTEDELQMAAFGVVPLAITLIWSISQRRKNL